MNIKDRLKRDAKAVATAVASVQTNVKDMTITPEGLTPVEANADIQENSTVSSTYNTTITPPVDMEALKKVIQNSDNFTAEDEKALINIRHAIMANPKDPTSQEACKMIIGAALRTTNKFVMLDQYYDASYTQNTSIDEIRNAQQQWKHTVNALLKNEGVRNNIKCANMNNERNEPVTTLAEYRRIGQVITSENVYADTERATSKEYIDAVMIVAEAKNTKSKEYKEALEEVDKYEKEFYLLNGVKLDFVNNKYNREVVYRRHKYKEQYKSNCRGGRYPSYNISQNFIQEQDFLNNPRLKNEVYEHNYRLKIHNVLYGEGETSDTLIYKDKRFADGTVKYTIPLNVAEDHLKHAKLQVADMLEHKISNEDIAWKNNIEKKWGHTDVVYFTRLCGELCDYYRGEEEHLYTSDGSISNKKERYMTITKLEQENTEKYKEEINRLNKFDYDVYMKYFKPTADFAYKKVAEQKAEKELVAQSVSQTSDKTNQSYLSSAIAMAMDKSR